MITLKTGVPGSGKTLSAVAELLALYRSQLKGAEVRPLYTNITGLSIPHFPMRNWEPNTKREEGVLYTIDWRECPVNAIIVIDEAYLYGYDAKSAQATVPDYIRDLAVHRKDYSVDIIFIAQHPKLMHVAARRQVGKHQHYRRLFGWGRAVCYEWDMAQDNLSLTKTAVTTQFTYSKDVFKAYKSAEVHTKPQFKLPWWVWIPVALVPLAAWAIPAAVTTLSGAMSGKGIPNDKLKAAAPAVAPAASAPLALPVSLPAAPVPPVVPPQSPLFVQAKSSGEIAGCIVANQKCGCFDGAGKSVEVEAGICEEKTGQGLGAAAKLPAHWDAPKKQEYTQEQLDALQFAFLKR